MVKSNNEELSLKEALLKSALGYDYEETIKEAVKDGKPKVKIIKRHAQPNPKSIAMVRALKRAGEWDDMDKKEGDT